MRDLLDAGPEGARAAFVELVQRGPQPVEALLDRGWWGRGLLPPPLDWLQRRGLVLVGADGLVRACREAAHDFGGATAAPGSPAGSAEAAGGYPDSRTEPEAGAEGPEAGPGEDDAEHATTQLGPARGGLRVEPTGCVVVVSVPATLDRALGVAAAQLRAVAPTVAVSERSAETVRRVLEQAGLPSRTEPLVTADPAAPPLPGTAEEAVAPSALRTLLQRAVTEARQVRLEYFASSRGGAPTDRVVDPWGFGDDLLRGYCHLRAGERTFAVDRIGRARMLPGHIEHLEA